FSHWNQMGSGRRCCQLQRHLCRATLGVCLVRGAKQPIRFSNVAVSFLSAFFPACFAGVITWTLRRMMLSETSALTVLIVCAPVFTVLYFSISMLSQNSRSLIFEGARALFALRSQHGK